MAAMALVSLAAKAEMTEGLFVKVGDTVESFAISNVKEVLFADESVTVVQNDDTEVSFSGDWLMTFGDMVSTDLTVKIPFADAPAEVYTLDGLSVLKLDNLSDLRLKGLPTGVYIIKCDGKSLKIKI